MEIVLRMNLKATKVSIPCYLLENKKQYIAEILVSAKQKTKLTFKSNFNSTQEPHAAPPL